MLDINCKVPNAMKQKFTHFSKLTDLGTFDPRIFEGDNQASQDVCNFTLTLACIYNDYKDILLSFHYLEYMKPGFPFKETPIWGEYNGLKFHLIRLHLSLVYELLNLIEKNSNVINNPFFQSVTDQLDNLGHRTWQALVNAYSGKANTSLGKTFLMIRNKVSFHYDPKEFFKGYKNWFLQAKEAKLPYISRGRKITEERFYFAEASAQSYYDALCCNMSINLEQIKKLATCVGPALSQIVKIFIDNRCITK